MERKNFYNLLAFNSLNSMKTTQRWKKRRDGISYITSPLVSHTFLCSIFLRFNRCSSVQSLFHGIREWKCYSRWFLCDFSCWFSQHFWDSMPVTNFSWERDKETLNKLRVRAITDLSRRAVNCTIMVSYISLLLTVAPCARHKGQMRFFTPSNRSALKIESISSQWLFFLCVSENSFSFSFRAWLLYNRRKKERSDLMKLAGSMETEPKSNLLICCAVRHHNFNLMVKQDT